MSDDKHENVENLVRAAFDHVEQDQVDNTTIDVSPEQAANRSRQIGPYKLLQEVGEGGMGTVWMAEQLEPVRRRVAIKLIKPGQADKQIIARFEAERQALAIMDHQNIAKVLDAGVTEQGQPYFAMELVPGIPLTKYCDKNKLTPDERLELFIPVCRAIQHAHQKGIIHRDIKPSNVLVTLYDGKPVPKVIDFGLAKALQTRLTDKTMFTEFGKVIGTLNYMSPEQAEMNALDVDTRTDIYSLGVMLYELLTGSTPLEKETAQKQALLQVLQAIREDEPPRPSQRLSNSGDSIQGISDQRKIEPGQLQRILRGELDWIVMKALEKDRTRRYATANDFADDVQRYISGDVVEARPPTTVYKLSKLVRKNRGLVASGLTIVSLLVAGVLITSWLAVRAKRAELVAVEHRGKVENALSQAEKLRHAAVLQRQEAEEARKSAETAKVEAEAAAARADNVLQILTNAFAFAADWTEFGSRSELSAKNVLVLAYESIGDSRLDKLDRLKLLERLKPCFYGLGELQYAIKIGEQALQLKEQVYGQHHPQTVESMVELAQLYKETRRIDCARDAVHLLENALWQRDKADRAQGNTHSGWVDRDVLVAELVMSYLIIDQTEEALRFASKAAQDDTGDPDHLFTLAKVYAETGRSDESVELGEKALELTRSLAGAEENFVTLLAMRELAYIYKATGHLQKAVALYEAALVAATSVEGDQGWSTQLLAAELALTLSVSPGMEKQLTRSLLEVLRQNSSHNPRVMSALALAEYRLDNLAQAIDVASIFVEGGLRSSPFVPSNLAVLAMSHLQLGQREQANKYRAAFEDAVSPGEFVMEDNLRQLAEEVGALFASSGDMGADDD